MKRTLKRRSKVLEIVKRETNGTSNCAAFSQPWEPGRVLGARRRTTPRSPWVCEGSPGEFGVCTGQRRIERADKVRLKVERRHCPLAAWRRLLQLPSAYVRLARVTFPPSSGGARSATTPVGVPADLPAAEFGVCTQCLFPVALWRSRTVRASGTLTKWCHLPRLETRTKESNMYASIWAQNPHAKRK